MRLPIPPPRHIVFRGGYWQFRHPGTSLIRGGYLLAILPPRDVKHRGDW